MPHLIERQNHLVAHQLLLNCRRLIGVLLLRRRRLSSGSCASSCMLSRCIVGVVCRLRASDVICVVSRSCARVAVISAAALSAAALAAVLIVTRH
eukprot:3250706-Pleurochrysis_carterae.AAC.3